MKEILSDVAETALITLRARVLEAQREDPIIDDVVGVELLDKLQSYLPADTRDRILKRSLSFSLTRHIALRSRKYDSYVKAFIDHNPEGLVVSLGCGFDTRYWRISRKPWRYVEVDLPEVIRAKKAILNEDMPYSTYGSSVLEDKWIQQILAIQCKNVLFLAEGLFMYLPQEGVEDIFSRLSRSFSQTWIVFEVVNKKYTIGLWKWLVAAKMKRALGTRAGIFYDFGVHDARDIESYGDNIKVTEEWSYLEDKDIKPKFLRFFRNCRAVSRTQWTVKASIG